MFMRGTLDDAANIEAINEYVMNAPLKTSAGAKARDKWLEWHDNLGWYDKGFPSLQVYDRARNLKHAFDLANAPTPAAKEAVKESMKTSLTSEELRGETKRTTSEGGYLEPPEEPTPWLPMKTKIVLGLAGTVIFAALTAKKIYLDPIIGRR